FQDLTSPPFAKPSSPSAHPSRAKPTPGGFLCTGWMHKCTSDAGRLAGILLFLNKQQFDLRLLHEFTTVMCLRENKWKRMLKLLSHSPLIMSVLSLI
uniref:Uncharacterized protein n=1 Tax=Calidris pygmaea TaxID=425635 RepID=A0A8C3J4V4_9CHAR